MTTNHEALLKRLNFSADQVIIPARHSGDIKKQIDAYTEARKSNTERSQTIIRREYPEIITYGSVAGVSLSELDAKIKALNTKDPNYENRKAILELCKMKRELIDAKKKAISLPKDKNEYLKSLKEREDAIEDYSTQLYQGLTINIPEIKNMAFNGQEIDWSLAMEKAEPIAKYFEEKTGKNFLDILSYPEIDAFVDLVDKLSFRGY